MTLLQGLDEHFHRQDIQNLVQKKRKDLRLGLAPIAGLLRWLPNNGFYVPSRAGDEDQLIALSITTPQCIRLARAHNKIIVMDSTYKTNKHDMPLFHLVGFDCNYRTFTIAYCFLAHEKEDDFNWALTRLRELITPDLPVILVTDRELALINAYQVVFPQARGLLCIWHSNMNILARCRKTFDTEETYKLFYKDIQGVIYAKDKCAFVDAMASMELSYTEGKPLEAFKYWKKQWIDKYQTMSCYAFSSNVMTFNTRFTSRVEGAHAHMKHFLRSSSADLNEACRQLKELIRMQHLALRSRLSLCYSYVPMWASVGYHLPLFEQVIDKVTTYALEQAWFQHQQAIERIEGVIPPSQVPCNCPYLLDWGLPCQHTFYHLCLGAGPP